MLHILLPLFKPVLQQIRFLQVAKNCCRKYGVVLLFATKLVLVARFTSPLQTCFAASDVTPVYGVNSRVILSNQKLVFTQLAATFICCKTSLNVGIVKHSTSLFNSFCSNVAKQVARFYCLCYRTFSVTKVIIRDSRSKQITEISWGEIIRTLVR